jgi:hypothetical protein
VAVSWGGVEFAFRITVVLLDEVSQQDETEHRTNKVVSGSVFGDANRKSISYNGQLR